MTTDLRHLLTGAAEIALRYLETAGDGAFGLWAAATPSLRHLLDGVGLADSWATDAHKWLNVPYDCGIVLCAYPDSHRAAMTLSAAYLTRIDFDRP